MATLFTHSFIGISLAVAAPKTVSRPKFMLAAGFLAVFPDADVVAFALGIPYADPLGHRGLTHSLLFSLFAGFLCSLLFVRQIGWWSRAWWQVFGLLSLAAASHGVLDALTDAGLGVGFFIPLDNSRYFFPFRPIATSPIGISRFFSGDFVRILVNEVLWVWLPTISVLAAYLCLKRARSR